MDDKDVFYDCCSESDAEFFSDVCTEIHGNAHGDGIAHEKSDPSQKQMTRFDDPAQIRTVLERAALATRMMLRCYGGDGRSEDDDEAATAKSAALARFYPATLEINARLHTEESCSCPKACQCQLRGDPVTLKLPLELNPFSGQVNVDIYQPKSLPSGCKGAGPARKCLCNKRKAHKLPCRTVRWSQDEDLGKDF